MAVTAPERYVLAVLNAVVGGGMSSRLFQEVREKRGLVYAIGSFEALFREGGMFAVSAGMSPKHLPTVVSLVREAFDQVAAGDVGEEELQQAKRQLKGSMELALEVPRHRMMRMAQDELYFGRDLDIDEVLASIDAVTPAQLAGLASRLLRPELLRTTIVGPLRRWPAGVA
jgi:predicted Zn-dependent peptidase